MSSPYLRLCCLGRCLSRPQPLLQRHCRGPCLIHLMNDNLQSGPPMPIAKHQRPATFNVPAPSPPRLLRQQSAAAPPAALPWSGPPWRPSAVPPPVPPPDAFIKAYNSKAHTNKGAKHAPIRHTRTRHETCHYDGSVRTCASSASVVRPRASLSRSCSSKAATWSVRLWR
jgi:hypothetical protein